MKLLQKKSVQSVKICMVLKLINQKTVKNKILNMKNLTYLLLILSLSVFVSSCGEDADVTAPTLEVLFIAPTPQTRTICGEIAENVIVLKGGELFEVELQAKDDVALSQYKMELHENFDCHEHKSNPTITWAAARINDLTQPNARISETFRAPTNITAGNYHFQIELLDAAGNELENPLTYDIKVQNVSDTIPPTIVMNAPSANSFALSQGNTINFNGTITDNLPLSRGENASLELEYINNSNDNRTVAKTIEIIGTTLETYDFDFDFVIPDDFDSGSYTFVIKFSDGVNNKGEEVEFEVQVN